MDIKRASQNLMSFLAIAIKMYNSVQHAVILCFDFQAAMAELPNLTDDGFFVTPQGGGVKCLR